MSRAKTVLGRPPVHHVCGGGYTQDNVSHDGRPHFTCTKCGDDWTSGWSGGPYVLADGRDIGADRRDPEGARQWDAALRALAAGPADERGAG